MKQLLTNAVALGLFVTMDQTTPQSTIIGFMCVRFVAPLDCR